MLLRITSKLIIVAQEQRQSTFFDAKFFSVRNISENWAGPENFDIYFSYFFDCYCQSFISGREGGH